MSACQIPQKSISKLDIAETFIETDPEKAMTLLNEAKRTISSDEEEARYALLMSIAMDMADIAYTSDSLIHKAVKYYDKHGSADEKLKAYYYMYVAYYNQGDSEKSMSCLVKANQYALEASDHISIGRLYAAFAVIYYNLNDYKTFLNYSKKAEMQYGLAKDKNRQAKAGIRVVNGFLLLAQYDSAAYYMNMMRHELDSLPSSIRSAYFTNKLILDRYTGQNFKDDIAEYMQYCFDEDIAWTQVAACYTQARMFREADDALEKYRLFHPNYVADAEYQLRVYRLADSLKQYKRSLEAYKIFSELTDSTLKNELSKDTKFIKERYENDIEKISTHDRFIHLCLWSAIMISSVSLVAVIFYISVRRKRNENLEFHNKLLLLESERDNLKQILDDKDTFKNQNLVAVQERYNLLNSILVSWITTKGLINKNTIKNIDLTLEDPAKFMQVTYNAFQSIYPMFITYLKCRHLTQNEIMITCLYAMGMTGKEIKIYTKRSSHYNDSSAIREKLGLNEHGENLGPYIKKLLKSQTISN